MLLIVVKISEHILNRKTKGQLTRTFCERLFCSSSNARIGVSERPSGRMDSGRLGAVEKTWRERRVHATATLTRLLVSVFLADHTGVHSTATLIPTASCFKLFCIKPMRYIYHPQRDCYLDVKSSVCCRLCELTLS